MGHNGFSVEKDYIRRAVSNKSKLCRIAAPEIAFLQFSGAAFLFYCNFAGFLACGGFYPNNQADEEIIEFDKGGKRYEKTI